MSAPSVKPGRSLKSGTFLTTEVIETANRMRPTMAKDREVLEEVGAITQAAAKQAHEAVDAYFDLLKKAISSFPSGGTKLGEKLKNHAEQNVAATQGYVKKMSQAKTAQEVIQIQMDFMQTQFNAFGAQAKDLAEAYSKAATDATKLP
jgi:hypothetical protein